MKNGRNAPILKLYPNVIPVKGYNRSLLMDLQKGTPYLVPNSLVDYLETPTAGMKEYEEFILQNELGLFVDPELGESLAPLSLEYHPDSKINNAILELDACSSWDVSSVLKQLDALGARFLEIRFLDVVSFENHFPELKKNLDNTTVEYLRIAVPFYPKLKEFLDSNLRERFFRLSTLVVYNATAGFELQTDFYNLLFTQQESVSHEQCGNVAADYFVISTEGYVRNRNYNSCLAHKISVDKDGLICNCPSEKSNYGNLDVASLEEVLSQDVFKDKWMLTKDEILVCSVCEFRWICSDCRAFTVSDLKNGKPSKCGYNPFINLWEGDENYLSEAQCGVVVTNGALQVNDALIAALNLTLWE